jgi:hypothetical protein
VCVCVFVCVCVCVCILHEYASFTASGEHMLLHSPHTHKQRERVRAKEMQQEICLSKQQSHTHTNTHTHMRTGIYPALKAGVHRQFAPTRAGCKRQVLQAAWQRYVFGIVHVYFLSPPPSPLFLSRALVRNLPVKTFSLGGI